MRYHVSLADAKVEPGRHLFNDTRRSANGTQSCASCHDPADVAAVGYEAVLRGDSDVISRWKNKRQSAIANVTPAGVRGGQHRTMAEPGSGVKK